MSEHRGFGHQGLVKMSPFGSSLIGLASRLYRPRFVADIQLASYEFKCLPPEARLAIEALADVFLGSTAPALSDEQRFQISIALDQTLQSLSSELRKEVSQIFILLNLPWFRWYLGLFGKTWHNCNGPLLLRAAQRFRDSKFAVVRVCYHNLQSLLYESSGIRRLNAALGVPQRNLGYLR